MNQPHRRKGLTFIRAGGVQTCTSDGAQRQRQSESERWLPTHHSSWPRLSSTSLAQLSLDIFCCASAESPTLSGWCSRARSRCALRTSVAEAEVLILSTSAASTAGSANAARISDKISPHVLFWYWRRTLSKARPASPPKSLRCAYAM